MEEDEKTSRYFYVCLFIFALSTVAVIGVNCYLVKKIAMENGYIQTFDNNRGPIWVKTVK